MEGVVFCYPTPKPIAFIFEKYSNFINSLFLILTLERSPISIEYLLVERCLPRASALSVSGNVKRRRCHQNKSICALETGGVVWADTGPLQLKDAQN